MSFNEGELCLNIHSIWSVVEFAVIILDFKQYCLSLLVEKSVFGNSYQVMPKQTSSATQTSWRLEISGSET